jgi:hypothetical protein
MKQLILFGLLFFSVHYLKAQHCNCTPLGPFSPIDTSAYAVIFQADINTVEIIDGVGKASVTLHELYKGQLDRNVQLQFESTDTCPFPILAGERWLIYGEYFQVKSILVDVCGRSRKYFRDLKADFNTLNTGQTYDEEVMSVLGTLGNKSISEAQLSGRELIKPKGYTLIFLIAFSLAGFLLMWFIMKKFLK